MSLLKTVTDDKRVLGNYQLLTGITDDTAAILREFGIKRYPALDTNADGEVAEAWSRNTGLYYESGNCLYRSILRDYNQSSEEFTSSFCDYYVKMSVLAILRLYEELMLEINGDYIMYIPDAVVNGDSIEGQWQPLEVFPDAYSIYEGNLKDFLEKFNNTSNGLYRLDMFEEGVNDMITGTICDQFIW